MQGSEPPLVPVPHVGGAPLSFAQERLWFLDQLEPDNPAYNLAGGLRLRGRLDVAAFAAALTEISRRHEILRTRFRAARGEPRQVISPAAPVQVPLLDLSGLPPAAREPALSTLALDEARRPFDLAGCVPLRVGLVRLGEEEHAALVTLHHIAADGWSLGIWARELAALYAFHQGEPSPLPELPVQYADFACWQREWSRRGGFEAQLAEWHRRLAGAPLLLELPTDRPRPAVARFRGGRVPAALPAELSRDAAQLARRQGATLFMLLLTAFQALLSRYSHQEDVLVATPVANRRHPETEGLIGLFANTVVLRGELSGNPAFIDLLARTRRWTLMAFDHQDVPFEKLVEMLQPERSASHAPLAQVAFALVNDPLAILRLRDLEMSPLEVESGTAKFDLYLALIETGEGLAGAIEHDRDLFDRTTAQRILEHFRVLLAGLVREPDRRIGETPLLTEAEASQLLIEWNDTASAGRGPESLAGLFAEQAGSRPDAAAVLFGDLTLTYGELSARAARVAARLRALGVGPEARVGLCMERSAELIVALVGILAAGGAYVPLDPSSPQARLRLLLAESGAVALVTAGGCPLADCPVPVVDLALEGTAVSEDGDGPPEAAPGQLAYMTFTSGSTGVPKGVEVPQRAVVRLVRSTGYARFGPQEVFLQLAPVSFDASTFEIWGALLHGARLVVAPPESPSLAELGGLLRRHDVTALWLTAGLFHLMVEERLDDLADVNQLLAGGEALSLPHVRRALAARRAGRIINGYGPTENTTFTACHPMSGADDLTGGAGSVPIGRPIAGTRIYLLDEALQPVPAGVAGELYTSGDGLARGYARRPDWTAERFLPDPWGPEAGGRLYRTGDRVRSLPDGRLQFLGRRDRQVKIRGFRIEPGEVEAALGRHPGVREAVVLVREDEPGDRRLVAYAVGEVEPRDLAAFLAAQLPAYLLPADIVTLATLPLTANGKIDRKALPAPPRSGPAGSPAGFRTPTEELLAVIWGNLLDRPAGAQDDFFALGGHSLLATRLVSRVREVFGAELPVRAVFEAPTVAALARRIEESLRDDAAAAAPPLVAAPPVEPLPLSFAQQRLWFIDQLEGGGPLYNIPAAFRIRGPLSVPACSAALSAIVRRHEALRTRFPDCGGIPAQVIDPPGAIPLALIDLAGLPERRRASALAS
ncbi:MAG TPA: amino acid adenylation domain-containing protein, partial [Thermoanaerobaculia bacterium]|nr:amino acid adenylation domain-containing protein [Thermoanaerobaculia bacterium]